LLTFRKQSRQGLQIAQIAGKYGVRLDAGRYNGQNPFGFEFGEIPPEPPGMVLPDPGPPLISVIAPLGTPPLRTSSSPRMPAGISAIPGGPEPSFPVFFVMDVTIAANDGWHIIAIIRKKTGWKFFP